jgi:5-methylcytosine-specific restriction protein A
MRKEFSRRVKALAFKRCCDEKGLPHCEGCGVRLSAGNIHYDHDLADGLGGEPILENCRVLCIKICHAKKTKEHDNPIMQKADRVLKKTYGIDKSRNPMPGSRNSSWKKMMNGKVVRRR